VDRRFDRIELARETQRDEAVQRNTRTAELAWLRHPNVSPVADAEAERVIAELSAEQTIDEMYRTAVEARLDIIYCPTLEGDLRKCWANRLGDINLSTPAAAADVGKLLAELSVYKEGLDGERDSDVLHICDRLWRLRALCERHQDFARSKR
jgi:hypothetical protein